MMWSRAVLSSTGVSWHSFLSPDAQPCSPLTISTDTCGLPQGCAGLALGTGSTQVGLFAVTSSVKAFLRTGGLCVGCSPTVPCRMTVDKSAPGETEQEC